GNEAERHKRLSDLVQKRLEEDRKGQAANIAEAQAARDGGALVDAGMNLVFAGEAPKGLQLMQQGLAKGSLKRPEDAKLHYAIAQILAGDVAKAQATLRTVGGTDGTADLARLWTLYTKQRK
ncbi:MAG TPA: hypothetical protein VFZ93_01575, partial [Albitalea sp.]